MAIIQDNDQYIKDLAQKYTELSKAASRNLADYQARLQADLAAKYEDSREKIENALAAIQRKNIQLNAAEEANFRAKYVQEDLRNRLEGELKVLREVGAAAAKEREAENEMLQLKINVQKAINDSEGKTGDDLKKAQQEISKARLAVVNAEKKQLEERKKTNKQEKHSKANKAEAQLNKQKARQDEKERQQAEGDAYRFGDIFYNAFADFRKEVNAGAGATVRKTAEENLLKAAKALGHALNNMSDAVNGAISSYTKYQTNINSRLQGISSFSNAVDTLSGVAFSPLLKAEDLYSNLAEFVGEGIVTNVEQRAFFQTIKNGIAETFDANAASLRRIIRIQQNDSTAARLGMEAYLNEFLNKFVENTEYLTSTFDNVAAALLEASALMSTRDSTEFEYVVQKWLGTLTGVGLSETSAQSIAEALGKVGAGDVDVLNSEVGILLTMSAARIGRGIGEMLTGGLDANETNDLLKSMVEYLQELSNNSKDNNVVKNQLAKIFGITVSDIAAIGQNLKAADIAQAYGADLNYIGMYSELSDQFRELKSRMGISNILENLFGNFTYQTGMNIASDPAAFATWKITDLIGKATGGINIPFVTALGSGIDLNATVDGLMKLGIVGISTIAGIGDIINGLGSIGDPTRLLDELGVQANMTEVKRGKGILGLTGGKRTSGRGESEVIYVGTNDSSAYVESALNSAKDEAREELDRKVNEYEDPLLKYLAETVELKEKLNAIVAAQNITAEAISGSHGTSVTAGSTSSSGSIIDNDYTTTFDSEESSSTYNLGGSTTGLHADAVKYLEDIEFSAGFRKLVTDVATISKKLDSTPASYGAGEPAGLNDGIYGKNTSGSMSGGSQSSRGGIPVTS